MPDAPLSVLPSSGATSAPDAPASVLGASGGGSAPSAPITVLASVAGGSAPSSPSTVLAVAGGGGDPSAPAAVLGNTAIVAGIQITGATPAEANLFLIPTDTLTSGRRIFSSTGIAGTSGVYPYGMLQWDDADDGKWVYGYAPDDSGALDSTWESTETEIDPLDVTTWTAGYNTTGTIALSAAVEPPAGILSTAGAGGDPTAPSSILASVGGTASNTVTLAGSLTDDGSPMTFPELSYVGSVASGQYAWTSDGTWPLPATGTWYMVLVSTGSAIAVARKYVAGVLAAGWQNLYIGSGRTDPDGVLFSPASSGGNGAGGTATATLVTYPEPPASVLP